MAIYDASPTDLRSALLAVRQRYYGLSEPRRWYAALVCAVLVRSGKLPEWSDWLVQPPAGAELEMTPAVHGAILEMFGVSRTAVMRVVPDGAVEHLNSPDRLMVDPLRQPGRATDVDSLCVVVGRGRIDVPVVDPSWLWNEPTAPLPATGYGNATEYKASNDYQQQQGIYCGYPADALFALGPADAAAVLEGPRPQCPHRILTQRAPRRKAADTSSQPLAQQPICDLNDMQCAAKQAASAGPGGPRALIPATKGSARKLLAPGSFERILDHANPNGASLPSKADFELILAYFHKGTGKALDSNRIHSLIAPEHLGLLFDP